jgi:hypothetical protein
MIATMNLRLSVFACSILLTLVAAHTAPAQSSTPVATSANTITAVANGIQLTFIAGSTPTVTAISTDAATSPAATPAASLALNPNAIPSASATPIPPIPVSKSFRFADKQGRTIDPKTIKLTERLQPVAAWGPSGPVLQAVVVDRD